MGSNKSWRPEKGWAELLLKHTRQKLDKSHPAYTSIEWGMLSCAEAGADALWEALQAEPAVRLNNKLQTIDQYIIKIKDLPDGIWRVLLIPEINPDLEELLIPEKGG